MAGSYSHIVDDNGRLLGNEDFIDMIENLGDAYEMAKEMYGMIWYLANQVAALPLTGLAIETARVNYRVGLRLAEHRKDGE